MAKEKPVIKPKGQYTSQEFAKAYQELCDKMGHWVVAIPTWVARDDGSWSLVLQGKVGPTPRLTRGS